MPSLAARSPRLAAEAWPLTRRISIALSMSPSDSVRAFLQSIIPAPVASRSFFTSAAAMFAMCGSNLLSVVVFEGGRSSGLRRGGVGLRLLLDVGLRVGGLLGLDGGLDRLLVRGHRGGV